MAIQMRRYQFKVVRPAFAKRANDLDGSENGRKDPKEFEVWNG